MSLQQLAGNPIVAPLLSRALAAAPVLLVRQQLSEDRPVWCWAACVEMVQNALRTTLPQCRIAEIALGKVCCPNLSPDDCVVPLAPEKVVDLWRDPRVGHPNATFVKHALVFNELVTALSEGPVEVWLGEKRDLGEGQVGGSGHVLLVSKAEGTQLSLLDPNPGNARSVVEFDELTKNALSYGTWVGSWIGI